MAVAVAATDHGIFPARSLALGLPGRQGVEVPAASANIGRYLAARSAIAGSSAAGGTSCTARVQQPGTSPERYRPHDSLLAFLDTL